MILNFIGKRIFYFFSIVTTCAFSQQIDEQLQSKYWTYKNRLHKYFIYYANQTQAVGGKGTPCYQHNIGKYGLQPLCTLGTTLSGHIKQSDAPEAIGMYMAALALEYRMLKDQIL